MADKITSAVNDDSNLPNFKKTTMYDVAEPKF
jgi:hypothetical protein